MGARQLLVYSTLITKDFELDFDKTRDWVEYGASFFDSKAVTQVRSNRENSIESSVKEEVFKDQIASKSFASKEVIDIISDIKNTNLKDSSKKKINIKKRNISGKLISKMVKDE